MEAKGTVKWYSQERGYGFIHREDTRTDVFAHWSNICGDGYRMLEDGQTVAFDVETSQKGPIAKNITVIHESEGE